MVNTDTGIFEYLPTIFLFPISPAECLIKNISKQLFNLIKFSTKITEFDNVKFPREFPKIDRNSAFSKQNKTKQNKTKQKNEYSKNANFLILFFQSVSHNNLVVTKQVYFSPTF